MIKEKELKVCSICGSPLKLFDRVTRIVRSEYGVVEHIKIRRFRCIECRKTHREVPDNLMPYKHYKKGIIEGFLNGSLTTDDLEYEDFPSELTVNGWRKQYGHNGSKKNH